MKLTSRSCRVIYTAVNKKIDSLDIMVTSHSLLDLSRYITDNDQLQKVIIFQKQYVRTFYLILNPTLQTFINNDHHKKNIPSNILNL